MGNASDDLAGAENAFAEAMFGKLAAAAEPILKRKLDNLGVVDFKVLGKAKAAELFRESLLESATLIAPTGDFDMLRRSVTAMTNDRFIAAMSVCRNALSKGFGAFDPVQGREAGILLAGFGLPVMPLDHKTLQPIGKVAISIEEADISFARAKTALVGYSSAEAPFHLMVTDCVNTLQSLIRSHPAFTAIKNIMEQDGRDLPTKHAPPFKHACLLVAKKSEDRVSSYLHQDPNPSQGSALLLSGWLEGEQHFGAFANGAFFVPQQLLSETLNNPRLIGWLNKPVGQHLTMH